MLERRDTSRSKLFTRRALMLGGGKLGLLSLLVGRMYYLQVLESDQYSMLADENRINMRLLPPPRGRVLDRFGVEIATNRQNFQVVLIPEQTDNVEQTLDRLARLTPIDEHQRARVLRDVKRKRSFVPIPVIDNLSWDEFARVNVHSPELPGIQLDVGETRDYPYGREIAHVIGYVGAVSEQDLRKENDPLLELPGFRIGKRGVEKYYDHSLRGKAGNSRVEVNAFGRVIREINRWDGQPGDDLVLTVDMALQKFVTKRLEGESSAAVVLDIHTGDILSIASMPSFDPNDFNLGIGEQQWRELVGDKRKPLTNKAIAGQYPPGSTFKMVVALAAMEAGVIGADHSVFCPGHTVLGNHTFYCWRRGGHGHVDLNKAIEQSCDVFFYDIAKKTGIDRIAEMARRFGLGEKLDLDLYGEKRGLVPTKAWKQAVYGGAWQQGETLIAGIGQGYVLATPLQLAVMTARIANGGFAVKPRLVRQTGEIEDGGADPGERAPSMGINRNNLALMSKAMAAVVNRPRGTAHGARIEKEGWKMAGKTGTAQVRRITKAERQTGVLKSGEKPWEERDHALFVGYAPLKEPRYAVAVIVEHGGSGSKAAAPIARDILEETQRLDPVRRPGRGRFAMWRARKAAETGDA